MNATATRSMRVASVHRYPVKSMLGETVRELLVDDEGAWGDRRLAVIDEATGRVASAKQARLWRELLKCSAIVESGRVRISLPDGTSVAADDDGVDDLLSQLLERPVRLVDRRPRGAEVERADPEQLLQFGVEAMSTLHYWGWPKRRQVIRSSTSRPCMRSPPRHWNTSVPKPSATGRTS